MNSKEYYEKAEKVLSQANELNTLGRVYHQGQQSLALLAIANLMMGDHLKHKEEDEKRGHQR